MNMITAEEFKRGMRHLAATVNVVSTMVEEEPRGMLATAVCSVCADPPTLLVSVNRNASMHGAISARKRFCVSVLDECQADTAFRFMSHHGSERFSQCSWDTIKTGAPAIRDALANFDCEVTSQVDVGTHTIYFGQIVAVRRSDNGQPLLYHDGNYAGLNPAPIEPACTDSRLK